MSKVKPVELLWCPWCKEISAENSKNGYCQKCYEAKLVHFIEKSACDSLAAKLDKAINALNKVQSFGLHHYEDCSNSDYDENPCSCGMEKTELLVLKTLDEIKEIKE